MIRTVFAAALFAASLGAAAASAASIDLAARGFLLGNSLKSGSGSADFLFDDGDGDPYFSFVYDDPVDGGNIDSFDFSSFAFNVVSPDLSGASVEVAADATSLEILFELDAATAAASPTGFVLAVVTPPTGLSFDFTQDFAAALDDATLEIFAVAPIPLPAAAPLLLAGLGALAAAARRRA